MDCRLAGLILLTRLFSSNKALDRHGMNQMFHRDDWLLVGMLLMVIGVLPQANWNSGQSVYTRYALWLCIPLMVWTVYQRERSELRRWWLRGVVVAQLFTLSMFGVFAIADDGSGYLQHKRVASAVLVHAPWAYNPEPEIFAETILSGENWISIHGESRSSIVGQEMGRSRRFSFMKAGSIFSQRRYVVSTLSFSRSREELFGQTCIEWRVQILFTYPEPFIALQLTKVFVFVLFRGLCIQT